ncbi:hypothetical protein WJX74_001759 [Apatococcus lobatus]|uniref:Mitochondrial import inner membrane translocase subunit Tim21 n=2 Tax=Apatococcus TaxID=904362 RepID=A0AAW1TC74_9CHLO
MSGRRALTALARLPNCQAFTLICGTSELHLLRAPRQGQILPAALLNCNSFEGLSSRGFAAQAHFVAASSQQKQQSQTALTREQEEFDALTDQIPQRPVGVVEGTSYTVVILAGLAFAGAILYAAVNELLIQPKEYACFNLALEKLRDDPRVTVRLGSPISGYGTESRNRAARQRIPHRTYVDANGTEHVQVQFHARGPSGVGRVSADMYKDSSKQWQYLFLYVDADVPVPSRVTVISPSS